MKYYVIESRVEIDGTVYTSFGIGCEHAGSHLFEKKDLCIDKERVEELVFLCNDLQIDPIHIDDVIADFLE